MDEDLHPKTSFSRIQTALLCMDRLAKPLCLHTPFLHGRMEEAPYVGVSVKSFVMNLF